MLLMFESLRPYIASLADLMNLDASVKAKKMRDALCETTAMRYPGSQGIHRGNNVLLPQNSEYKRKKP